MKTQVFKSIEDFRNREDFKVNGVSEEFANNNPEWEKDNETNEGCWNCSDCSDCSRCSHCSGLKNAKPIQGDEPKTGYPEVPIIANIHSKVLEAVSKPGAFNMSSWHESEETKDGTYCGTTHCRAGWVVTLAGKQGKILEDLVGTSHADMQIYHKSSPEIPVAQVRFHESNEIAMADIKRCAELEVKPKH